MQKQTEVRALKTYGRTPCFASVIKDSRIKSGMNQETFAAKINVSRNTVAGWETGHSRPDINMIPAICNVLQISLDRFFGRETIQKAEEREMIGLFRLLDKDDRQIMLWQMQAIAEKREEVFRKETVDGFIEICESELGAAAGFAAALDEELGEMIYVQRDKITEEADQIIAVNGRSMEPTYYDGDKVLVKFTNEIREGEIGIFLVNNEGYIKEYHRDGLHSHNRAYSVMKFSEYDSIRCIGKVIGKLKNEQLPDEKQLQILEEARRDGKRRKK